MKFAKLGCATVAMVMAVGVSGCTTNADGSQANVFSDISKFPEAGTLLPSRKRFATVIGIMRLHVCKEHFLVPWQEVWRAPLGTVRKNRRLPQSWLVVPSAILARVIWSETTRILSRPRKPWMQIWPALCKKRKT